MPKVKGKVPARIAAELRYLGRERDEYLIAENFEMALVTMDMYDRVYCRWYFENTVKNMYDELNARIEEATCE